ncbi:MAG: hypothetical protein HKN21_00885, partial [Candidatus Eisenbacteria bacterium]|nr:hypothetical protein [Candidatus Eisenbacteria bacterium]
DLSRVPEPIGAVNWVAPVPPPQTGEPENILVESQMPQRVSVEGQAVDWFGWMPLGETLVYRAKDRIFFTSVEGGGADTLMVESAPDAPFPSISASGEYFATVGASGSLWLKRFGVAASENAVNMDSPVTAIAFAPFRLELAYATEDKNVWLFDFSGTDHRLLGKADDVVQSLHWSPRGDMLAWSTTPRGAFDGFAQARGHALVPKTPKEAGVSLASPSQWSPDGNSVLGIGTGPEGSGLLLWDATSQRLLDGGFPLTNADISVAWDFEQIAYAQGEPPHPQPFGFDSLTPFAFDASPRSVVRLNWEEGQILDRPLHRAKDLCWDHQSRWLVHTLDERAESFGTSKPYLRQGLWAMNVETGEHLPLQRDPGSYSLPQFSPRGGWLGYLRSSRVEDDTSELWVRPMKTQSAKSRIAERMRLRSLPLLRKGDYEEAIPFLRDALRMNPDLESARLELAQAYRQIAGTVPSSAEAGLLLAAATREMTRLVAYVPGNPVYREELMETFFAFAVVSGRYYAFEAAERGRQLLAADPGATSDPDRVTQVIQPVLLDAWAWDPFHFEAREMLESALDHFRRTRN